MAILLLILLLLGLLALALAAFGVSSRISLGWAGLFLFGLVYVIERWPA